MKLTLVLRAAVLTAALLAPLHTSGAQVAELRPGVRVRVRAPSTVAGRLTGTVIARSADSVSLASPNAVPMQVPLSALTSVEVSRGKSRRDGAVRGVLWGAGVGAGFGLLVLAAPDYCEQAYAPGTPCSRNEDASAMVLGSVLTGALIGAIVGRERWERLSLPGRVSITPMPRAVGLQVGVGF